MAADSGEPRPDRRPRWWGPDWRTLPLAFWLTLLFTGVATGIAAEIVLRRADPGWFDPAKRNFRGMTPGDYVGALIAAAGVVIVMLVWLWYLRRRGWHGFDQSRRRNR